MASIAEQIVQCLHDALGDVKRPVALHEPRFSGREWDYVKECLDTGWVSSVGSFVDRFESELAAYTGIRHAIATVNGTAALHVCLLLAGIEAGDEVLVPTLTFVATANAISYCGAIPHFVDSDEQSLGVDVRKLRTYLQDVAEMDPGGCRNRFSGRPIKAVIPMHAFGHPVNLDSLAALCRDYGLILIEDAAESLGSYYRGRHVGNWGSLSALSFNGNKIVTTGGGGAILTNDPELARKAKHITTTAKLPHRWEFVHDQIAYNYRMPNLNAALGCAQLERMDSFVAAKRQLAERYRTAFLGCDGVKVFHEPVYARSNYWLNVLLLDVDQADRRDEVLETLYSVGFLCRPVWAPMHKLPMYVHCPCMELSCAESLERRIICVPSSAGLGTA